MSTITFSRIRISWLLSIFCAFGPFLTLSPWFGRHFSIALFAVTLPIASAVIVCFPIGDERSFPTLVLACASSAVEVVYLCSSIDENLLFLFMDMFVFVILAFRFYERYFSIRRLFRAVDFWNVMLSMSRLLLLSLLNLLKAIACGLMERPVGSVALAAADMLIYVFLLYREQSGYILIDRNRERELKALMRAYSESSTAPREPIKIRTAKESELMQRVMKVMETDKPFLDENFSIHQLSSLVYTNKTTLSKAINNSTGMNFCQFVNDYRIRYSLDLMERDPKLKVFELSEKSGFHNQVSFGMAFKLKMGITPGEYSLLKRSRQLCVPEPSVQDE